MAIERPETYEEAAAVLRAAGADRRLVRPRGGGTKWNWGAASEPDVVLSTGRLNRILEHNAGDLTAVLQAGVPLAEAQTRFASAGQMLALDPPEDPGATVGGLVAAADSGPLRHRYGAARDLLPGVTVALSDGTVARSGGRVIKNVAGYDLPKLFAGSFGTLGTIVEVVVRLHPLPPRTTTVVAGSAEPAALAEAALALAQAPLELEALDVAWEGGAGGRVLARVGGVAASARARRIASGVRLDATVEEDDGEVWRAQRARQRSRDGFVVRVSGLPTQLEQALVAADRVGGSLVGRAGLGLFWFTVPDARAVETLRRELAPSPAIVLDAPAEARHEVEAAAPADGALLRLSRRVKERFDPAGVCSPGVFA
jgi:glycolate oxidase FAD binding subunit